MFSPGVDYCSMGHSCDENATCMNLNTKYTCKCNQGFQGDGITCAGNILLSFIICYATVQYYRVPFLSTEPLYIVLINQEGLK